jgi:hypothetical protein
LNLFSLNPDIKCKDTIEMARARKRATRKRRHRKRGGSHALGAPTNYSLSNDWASRMSLGQGADFFKYHQGQHGGQAPMSAIDGSMLDPSLRGSAHLAGLDKAYADIAGMHDGGRRRTRSKKGGKRSKKGGKRSKKGGKRSRRHRRTHRSRGGNMGYAPFPNKGMLLDGDGYAQAGLNPEWKSAVEFDDTMMRQSM